jgi:hypothetical protein
VLPSCTLIFLLKVENCNYHRHRDRIQCMNKAQYDTYDLLFQCGLYAIKMPHPQKSIKLICFPLIFGLLFPIPARNRDNLSDI